MGASAGLTPDPDFFFIKAKASTATPISTAKPATPAGNCGTGGGKLTLLVLDVVLEEEVLHVEEVVLLLVVVLVVHVPFVIVDVTVEVEVLVTVFVCVPSCCPFVELSQLVVVHAPVVV